MRAHLCGPVMHTQWLYGGQGADTSSWKACVCVCACACRLEGQLPPPSAHLGQWCCGGHGVQRLQLAPLPPVFAVRQHVCMRHTCKCVCVCVRVCMHACACARTGFRQIVSAWAKPACGRACVCAACLCVYMPVPARALGSGRSCVHVPRPYAPWAC